MIKIIFKKLIISLNPLSKIINKFNHSPDPFLCVVTPVFDPCLDSLKGLIKDLETQTFPNFIHVLISNGPSPKIKSYINRHKKNKKQFIYIELAPNPEDTPSALQKSIGIRKNYGMKNYSAMRYVFIDSDSKIIDKSFIAKLYMAHLLLRKDVLVVQIKINGKIFPIFPVDIGRISLNNYTFSRKIALNSEYPTSPPKKLLLVTDYLYFLQINKKFNTAFLNFVYLVKDARKSYSSVSESIKVMGK